MEEEENAKQNSGEDIHNSDIIISNLSGRRNNTPIVKKVANSHSTSSVRPPSSAINNQQLLHQQQQSQSIQSKHIHKITREHVKQALEYATKPIGSKNNNTKIITDSNVILGNIRTVLRLGHMSTYLSFASRYHN